MNIYELFHHGTWLHGLILTPSMHHTSEAANATISNLTSLCFLLVVYKRLCKLNPNCKLENDWVLKCARSCTKCVSCWNNTKTLKEFYHTNWISRIEYEKIQYIRSTYVTYADTFSKDLSMSNENCKILTLTRLFVRLLFLRLQPSLYAKTAGAVTQRRQWNGPQSHVNDLLSFKRFPKQSFCCFLATAKCNETVKNMWKEQFE